jgi:hypothetical protein
MTMNRAVALELTDQDLARERINCTTENLRYMYHDNDFGVEFKYYFISKRGQVRTPYCRTDA